jgi:hypothetical protein
LRSAISPPSRRRCSALPSRRMGSSTGPHARGCDSTKPRRPDPHAVVPRRAGDHRDACRHPRRGACGRGRRVGVACGAAAKGGKPLSRHSGERIRIPGAARAHGRRAVAHSSARETSGGSLERACSRCTLLVRWSAAGRTAAVAATRSGPATSAPPSTSPTAPTAGGSFPSHRTTLRRRRERAVVRAQAGATARPDHEAAACLGVEDDRHRAVVDELDLHVSAEDSRRDRDSQIAQLLAEPFVHRLRELAPGGL